jgi:GH35 family endo-1,4-beta-xylanase
MRHPDLPRRRAARSLRALAAALGGLLTVASLSLRAFTVPEGTPLLRNGGFTEAPERPLHWVTRSTGDLGTFAVTPPGNGETSGVLHVTVVKAHAQPWMLELRQTLSAPLPKGRNLFLGFEYKITNGYAFHVYWQKDSPPWPKFLAQRISEPTGAWTPCLVAMPVPEDLAADKSSLSFHLAEARGTLEIRNLTAVLVAEHVDLGTIETTHQPVFGGDYYDNDWRTKVQARIESERKTDLQVEVTQGGAAAAGVEITVEQTARPFLIGVEVPAALLVDDLPETEDAAVLKRALAEARSALPKFREKIGQPGLFQIVTVTDALRWNNYAEWGADAAPRALAAVRARGQQFRGHAAYIPAFREAPPACRRMDKPALVQAVDEHVRDIVLAQQGKIAQWVVLHDMLGCSEIYDVIGSDSLTRAYQIAQKQDPAAALLVSDPSALLLPNAGRMEELIEFVTWLRAEGCKIAGICLGASLARPYMAPQAIEARLDLLAAGVAGVPIFITALELETDKEATQEAMLRDLLTLFFSHKAVAGVSFSHPWEPAAVNPKCALYKADMTPRKAGKLVESLFTSEWLSRGQGTADANGQFALRVFSGTYRISAKVGEKTVTANAEVSPDNPRVTIKAD